MTSPTCGEQLTYRQRKFCENYVISHNAKQSALAAGYAPKNADVTAAQNLVKPSIKNYIAELEGKAVKQATEAAILSKAEILQMFTEFAKDGKVRVRTEARCPKQHGVLFYRAAKENFPAQKERW